MTVEEALAEIKSLGPGESFSYRRAHDQRRLLSQRDELELVQYIRNLTKKQCPPTRQMIINFATPLCQWEPSEAWVSRLIHRHNDTLITAWTTPMESSRHEADNGGRYRLYFGLEGTPKSNSPNFQSLLSGDLLRLAILGKAYTQTLLGGTTKVGGQEEGLKQRGARNRFKLATNLRLGGSTLASRAGSSRGDDAEWTTIPVAGSNKRRIAVGRPTHMSRAANAPGQQRIFTFRAEAEDSNTQTEDVIRSTQ
ncbi:hypothetical protein EJ07DRAFT_181369 [Lizonia empirigonia]|nr:hypothetical protein EJ07DRAFT_181369 [Lizonia empirigonia]